MSSKLSFSTAGQEQTQIDNGTPPLLIFDVDGEEYAALRPKEDAYWLILQAASQASDPTDSAGYVGVFLDHCMTAADLVEALQADERFADDLQTVGVLARSARRLRDRMMDRKDTFGIRNLFEIMETLIELWFGNPTGQPQDFLPSQKPNGRKSTGRSSPTASTSSGGSGTRRPAR